MPKAATVSHRMKPENHFEEGSFAGDLQIVGFNP
jgi:hypothetical protein